MNKKHFVAKNYIESLPYKLELTARVSTLFGKHLYKDILKNPLDMDEFIILDTLLLNPGISQSDVARLVLKGKAHAGKILCGMEEKGYIKRIIAENKNMMIKQTEITEKGMQLYNETRPKVIDYAGKIMGNFSSDEIATFKKLLDKFRNSLLAIEDVNLK